MTMQRRIVLAGSLAGLPHWGGHSWVFLQYLLGFRRLGWDVTFIDWLDRTMCDGLAVEKSPNWHYLTQVMDGFGLRGHYSLIDRTTDEVLGIPRRDLTKRVREAALLINVMGFLEDDELLGAASRRVFLDIDPGFGQMWKALDLADLFAGHDAFVTVGRHIGRDGSAVPTCGLEWLTTVPPVVLDEWQPQAVQRGKIVSIGAWRGPTGPVTFKGETYGLRVHEFRRFLDLPAITHQGFELALDIHPGDSADRERLTAAGWGIADPLEAVPDPWAYRRYIASAEAEFGVAKGMYVKTAAGWFSDRSVCFLASGRPVIAQDTGIRDLYPTGEGLLVFSNLDEARDAVGAVVADPERHARAARELAETYFDSDKVLSQLLGKLGLE